MAVPANRPVPAREYVGTLVGESTSSEFRLAVAHEAIREQDIIAVEATLRTPGANTPPLQIRVWAKVQRIERINPLFPAEAGHELAATGTNPFETVLSMSREMVTAVCQVLGAEPLTGGTGKLEHLRYPPQPATSAYRPEAAHIARIVVGALQKNAPRAIDLATLANRPDVTVLVDGHAIVTRHLAILAMTGAGKSWTARRLIEQLAEKNYPIVIFDPHGEYAGLADVPALQQRVRRYYAQVPLFEEDSDRVADIVSSLAYPLTDTMRMRFGDVFQAARDFIIEDPSEMQERLAVLSDLLNNPKIRQRGAERTMWLIAHIAEAGELLLQTNEKDKGFTAKQQFIDWCWKRLSTYSGRDRGTLEGIKKRAYSAASALWRMEQISKRIARGAEALPTNRAELVRYGGISVVSLAGYTGDFQATIFSLVADDLFGQRVSGKLPLQVLLVLEEAHTFAPAQARTPAEQQAISTTKQIAQEGRKFGVGLIMISQRPSRVDETTLSQCNSYIIMRMVNPADQRFVRQVVETLGEEEARMLPDLDVGEALLSGQLVNFPVLVRIKKPDSPGAREEQDAFAALEEAQAAASQGTRQ